MLALWGCGGDEPGAPVTPGQGPPALRVVPGAPALAGEEPDSQEHSIEGYAAAMASRGALLAVGTTVAVYEIGGAGPVELPIVGDEPDLPLATGQVRAMAPYDDGLLVAAEQGLFFTAGGALQRSLGAEALAGLSIESMGARIADDDGDGVEETHLSVLAADGAYEIAGGEMVRWTVEGEAGAPSAMLAQRDRVLLAFGRRVYEVDKAGGAAYPLVFEVGAVSAIACDSVACDEGSLLYFASDAGLVERAADGSYTLYPLAAEGEPAVPVEAFGLDATKQRLYALAGPSVLRIRAGEVPDAAAAAPPAELPRRLSVDKIGDVWTGAGTSLRKLALGAPLSFATDVRPIMHEYCAGCHADGSRGAPRVDFESYEVMSASVDVVLARITQGTMPPPDYEKTLPGEKIQILEDWSVTRAP